MATCDWCTTPLVNQDVYLLHIESPVNPPKTFHIGASCCIQSGRGEHARYANAFLVQHGRRPRVFLEHTKME